MRHQHTQIGQSRPNKPATTQQQLMTACVFAGLAAATIGALYYFNYLPTISNETLATHPQTKQAYKTLAKTFLPDSINNMAHSAKPKCFGMVVNTLLPAPFPERVRMSAFAAKTTPNCDTLIQSLQQFVVQQLGAPQPMLASTIRGLAYVIAGFFTLAAFGSVAGALDAKNAAAAQHNNEDDEPARTHNLSH